MTIGQTSGVITLVMKLHTIAAIVLSSGFLTQAQAKLEWLTDFEAGKKAAEESGKSLLVDFTGSDWCHWCIQLDKEVFSQPAFEAVSEDYILVALDFPQGEDLITPEQRAKNEALAQDLSVGGFPTVILFDAQGRPYARTGYQEGGPEAYLAHLALISKPWKDLQSAEGEARQGALLAFLQTLPGEEVEASYPNEMEELIALDPEDKSGFVAELNSAKRMALFEDQVEASLVAEEFDQVLTITDAFLAEDKPEGERKQHVLMAKVMVHFHRAEQEKAFTLLDEIAAIVPESEIAANLDQIKNSIAQELEVKRQMEAVEEKVAEEAKAEEAAEEEVKATEEKSEKE